MTLPAPFEMRQIHTNDFFFFGGGVGEGSSVFSVGRFAGGNKNDTLVQDDVAKINSVQSGIKIFFMNAIVT